VRGAPVTLAPHREARVLTSDSLSPPTVDCAACRQPIGSRHDLIIGLWLLWPRALHARCFGRALKTWRDLLLWNIPFNSLAFTVGLILVALSIPLDPEDPVTAAIGLYLIAARLFTWWALAAASAEAAARFPHPGRERSVAGPPFGRRL